MVGSATVIHAKHFAEAAKSQSAIWIIDDNEQFSGALASYINQITDSQRTACLESAEKGISLLESGTKPPGVILLDVDMPGMSGLDAIPVLREKAPDSKIFMVTGTDSIQRKRIALERGAEDYLLKLDLNKDMLLRIVA